MTPLRFLALTGATLLLLASCIHSHREVSPQANAVAEADSAALVRRQAELWADSIMQGMTPGEQAAQLLMPALYATDDIFTLKRLKWYAEELKVGAILLLKGESKTAAQFADTLEAARDRIPFSPGIILAVDAETGLGMRFSDAPQFPWNKKIDREADSSTFYDYGREVGREARILGINMVLGPVVDISRIEQDEKSVMDRRSLGSDQLRVADLSIAYTLGLESRMVGSVVKHFPGHGPTAADSHKKLPAVNISKDELYAIDMHPFRLAAKEGVSGIMVGHIWSPALDSVARPASFSPVVITDILRHEMGFDGLVLVDAVNMEGARGYSGVDALKAGADMLIAPADTRKELDSIMRALAEGSITPERIEESCRRILAYKYLHGIHNNRRLDFQPDGQTIEERLRKEAPDIIGRLNGN